MNAADGPGGRLGAPTADRQENLAISRAAVDAGEGALAGTTADARARMAKAAREMGIPDAGERVVAQLQDLASSKSRRG